MIPAWEAGKTYTPGALVRPASASAPTSTPVANGDFESGTANWDFPAGFSIVSDKNYSGAKSVKYLATGQIGTLLNTSHAAVVPGQAITAKVYVSLDHIAAKQASGRVLIQWFNASGLTISQTAGPLIDKAHDGVWQLSQVTGVAPAGAVSACIGISAASDDGGFSRFDAASWNYVFQGQSAGLTFKAVQANPGKSAANEPIWPTVNGQTVVDNEVTWEAVQASRLVWQASPLLTSGATEPDWPLALGGNVVDGSINWEAITPRITDPNCPNTKVVAIAASKVYAAATDVIRYSATVDPTDWTTADDAGYLPYGLQTYGSNPVAALGLYRSNLAAFNSEGFQMWQVDEDPAASALLDALPVGSTHNAALSPVSNDLFFLSSQGVRTIGIAASSTNLQAGDVGMPVDDLIKAAIGSTPIEPIGIFVPAMGQYWLAISGLANADPSISGHMDDGFVGTVIDTLYTVTGGTDPIVFDILSGALPGGIALETPILNPDGTTTVHATGTFTQAGEPSWVLRATDASGRSIILYDSVFIAAAPIINPESSYRFLEVPLGNTVDYSAPGFDDSSWSVGQTPAANSDSHPYAGDEGWPTQRNYTWQGSSKLWMRASFTLDSPQAMTFEVFVDNYASLWVNGTKLLDRAGTVELPSGPAFNHIVSIPASLVVTGVNSIVVLGEDSGNYSYLACRMSIDR